MQDGKDPFADIGGADKNDPFADMGGSDIKPEVKKKPTSEVKQNATTSGSQETTTPASSQVVAPSQENGAKTVTDPVLGITIPIVPTSDVKKVEPQPKKEVPVKEGTIKSTLGIDIPLIPPKEKKTVYGIEVQESGDPIQPIIEAENAKAEKERPAKVEEATQELQPFIALQRGKLESMDEDAVDVLRENAKKLYPKIDKNIFDEAFDAGLKGAETQYKRQARAQIYNIGLQDFAEQQTKSNPEYAKKSVTEQQNDFDKIGFAEAEKTFSEPEKQLLYFIKQREQIAESAMDKADKIKALRLADDNIFRIKGSPNLYSTANGELLGKEQMNPEQKQTAEAIDKRADELVRTYKGNLGHALAQTQYSLNSIEKQLAAPVGFEGANNPQVVKQAENLRKERDELWLEREALKKAYFLNESSEGRAKDDGVINTIGRFIKEGAVAVSEDLPYAKEFKSSVSDLNYANQIIDASKVYDLPVTKGMEEAAEPTLSETLGTGTGQLVKELPKLIAVGLMTEGVGEIAGLTNLVKPLLKSERFLDKAVGHFIKSTEEGVKFHAVFDDFAGGAGFYGGQQLMGKFDLPFQPTGFWGKALKTFVNYGIHNGLGGGAVGMGAGGLANAIVQKLTGDKDFSEAIDEHFGKTLDDKGKVVYQNLLTGLIIGFPHFGKEWEQVKKNSIETANKLRDNGMPNDAADIEKVVEQGDKIIAKDKEEKKIAETNEANILKVQKENNLPTEPSQERIEAKGETPVETKVEPNWDMRGEGDVLSGKSGELGYTQKLLPEWNRASQRGEINPESKITYDADGDTVMARDENGVVIGKIKMSTLNGKGKFGIEHLAVAPEFRRKGVATELLKQLKENNPNLDVSKTELRSKGFADLINSKPKETKVAEPQKVETDTQLSEGLQNVKKESESAFLLLQRAFQRGIISERVYNEVGKELKDVKGKGKNKKLRADDAVMQVAEIIQKHANKLDENGSSIDYGKEIKTERDKVLVESQTKENKSFDEKAYPETNTKEENDIARIEDKFHFGEELNPTELKYVNENFFKPDGWEFDKDGNLVKQQKPIIQENAVSKTKETEVAKEETPNEEPVAPTAEAEVIVPTGEEEKVEPVGVVEKPVEDKLIALEKEYEAKPVEELVALKKKLYGNADIESPMSAEEKLLNKVVAKKFSDKNQAIRAKQEEARKAKEDTPQVKKQKTINSFIDKVTAYNEMSEGSRGKKSTKGARMRMEIKDQAKELGIHLTERGFSFVPKTKEGGTRIRKNYQFEGNKSEAENHIPLEKRSKETQELFDLMDNGGIHSFPDVVGADGKRLSNAQKESAIDDIRNGRNTKAADALLNVVDKANADGYIEIRDRALGTQQIDLEVAKEHLRANEEVDANQEQQDVDAANFDLLPEREQDFHNQNIQDENNIDNQAEVGRNEKEELPPSVDNGTGKKESKPTEEVKPNRVQSAKEKLQAAKDKAKSIRDAKNNLKAVDDPFEQAKREAEADREVFDAYVNLAKEYIKSTADKALHTVEEFAKAFGEKVEDVKAAWEEAIKEGKKKTLVTERAYEGEVREGVKKELEKLGLTRDIDKLDVAEGKAKEFVATVGDENALEAIRNGDVDGATAAFVFKELAESLNRKAAVSTDAVEVARLEKLQADLLNEWGNKQWKSGAFNSAMQKILVESELNFNSAQKTEKWKSEFGTEPSSELLEKWKAQDAELKELNKKLVEAEERVKKAEEEKAVADIKESVEREKKSKKPTVKRGKDLIAEGLDDLVTALGGKKMAVGDRSPSVSKALEKIGRGLIDEGIASIENVAEKVREYVNDKFPGKLNFDDYEEGFNGRVAEMNGGHTKGKLNIPHSLIRDLVESGIDNINDLTKAVHKKYPNATEREVRDAITGYGKVVNPNQEEVATQIRKMKRIGKAISALEDVANKKRPLRSGQQRDKLDAQERALNKELREAMKDLPMDEADLEQQLKTQLDAAKQRTQNQIEDLQREIDKGELTPKSARSVKEDAELKALKEKRDKLKEEHEKIFKDEEYKNAKRLELSKKAAERSIEDLQRRLREGDFSKKKTTPVAPDTELVKLRAEKLRIKEEYDKEVFKEKLKNRTAAEKIKDSVWELWGIPRVLMATGEMSFVGIQGLKQSIAHPITAARAFKNALSFMKSEKNADTWLREVKSQEWYPTLKQSKLALTEPHAELTAREELFYSGWSNLVWDGLGKAITSPARLKGEGAYIKAQEAWSKLNPLKALERGAVGYLDTIRVERFLSGMEMLKEKGKTFENSPQDYKDVADAINTMTGRASLGGLEQQANLLSKVFFSPRNWASGIKTATPYALYHFGKMTPTARKMAIADFSKFVGLTTGMVMMAAAKLNNDDDKETGVEFDPRSTDFMKIKLGDTRVDPWGGMQQQIVLSSRLMADGIMRVIPQTGIDGGYKKDGEVMPLGVSHKSPSAGKLIGQQALNKLNPTADLLYNYLNTTVKKDGTRTNDFGQEYTVKSELEDKFHPIFWSTVSDLLKDDPNALNGLLAFYAFFGGGVNVYDDKKKVEKKKSSFSFGKGFGGYKKFSH